VVDAADLERGEDGVWSRMSAISGPKGCHETPGRGWG
jgi:hypothetical protein